MTTATATITSCASWEEEDRRLEAEHLENRRRAKALEDETVEHLRPYVARERDSCQRDKAARIEKRLAAMRKSQDGLLLGVQLLEQRRRLASDQAYRRVLDRLGLHRNKARRLYLIAEKLCGADGRIDHARVCAAVVALRPNQDRSAEARHVARIAAKADRPETLSMRDLEILSGGRSLAEVGAGRPRGRAAPRPAESPAQAVLVTPHDEDDGDEETEEFDDDPGEDPLDDEGDEETEEELDDDLDDGGDCDDGEEFEDGAVTGGLARIGTPAVSVAAAVKAPGRPGPVIGEQLTLDFDTVRAQVLSRMHRLDTAIDLGTVSRADPRVPAVTRTLAEADRLMLAILHDTKAKQTAGWGLERCEATGTAERDPPGGDPPAERVAAQAGG